MTWQNSFELYGNNLTAPNTFKAKCKLCGEYSPSFTEAKYSRLEHFKHCSRFHGYVFDENYDIQPTKGILQRVIIDSMLYDLPLPGYETHKTCVKQYQGSKPVCIIHYS